MNQQTSMISVDQCPGYQGCKAPLCPMDSSFLKATWFNSEPICQAIAYRRERWRIAQRRIDRAAKDHETCYTVAMLSAVRQVRSGIVGLSPEDIIDTERVRTWINQRSGSGSFKQKGSESAINKKLDSPGPSFAPSENEAPLTEGQAVAAV